MTSIVFNLNTTAVAICAVIVHVILISPIQAKLMLYSSFATTTTEGENDTYADAATQQSPAASVTLLCDRKEFFVGELVEITYCLTNVGTEPFLIEFGGDYRGSGRHERFKVTMIDANDKEVPDVLLRPMNFGGLMGPKQELRPGQQYTQTLELHKYRRLAATGQYTIRVVHDLGWDSKTHQPPVGETTIILKLPNKEDAQAVMAKSPDLGLLQHPVYLSLLLDKVRNGDRSALSGIANIHTVEATEALLGLVEQGLRDNDLDLALSAYGSMSDRLPNPRFYQNSDDRWYKPHRTLVEQLWRSAFSEPLRRLASRLAGEQSTRALGEISFIFECVGTAEDMPSLILAYTKSIEATKTLPFETHQYFRPRGSAYSYRFSTRQLLSRGAKVPTDPQTSGDAAVYLIAMQMRDDFRPVDWPQKVLRWLRHETPYMREFVLEHMPEPIPEAALQMLPELLGDDYVDLQIAACHTAQNHPREAFRQPILAILQDETENYLLNAAAAAGPANGITNDLIMEIWIDRLDNNDLGAKAVVRLLLSILDDNVARTKKKLQPDEITKTKERWRRFIAEHREKLRKGHRFKLGDPEITSDLFTAGFQFYFEGKPWPPQ